MDIYRPLHQFLSVLSFYYLLSLSLIAEPLRISLDFIALPPRPFKQARDDSNDDGIDALYHHLVLVLYEIGSLHYHEILINPLDPFLSSPTLIHAMRLTNPMTRLII